jgi:hypothetical protein
MDFPMPTLPEDYNPAPEGAYGLEDGLPDPQPADPQPEATEQP